MAAPALARRLVPLLVVASAALCSCQECIDNDDECPDWAADGECKKSNSKWMKANCRRSCGRCSVAEVASDLLGEGAYAVHLGKLETPTGKYHIKEYHVLKAAHQCNRTKTCLGISVQVAAATADSPYGVKIQKVTFGYKSSTGVASVNETLGWVSFLKASGGQCYAPFCNGTSWVEQQTARFHLRSAELYTEHGARGARGVIRHAKAALESGAPPEEAYSLRAHAYLRLDRVDDCRRDADALLELQPAHEDASALRRSADAYKDAVDAAVQLERGKKWADALLRYKDALAALPDQVVTERLRKGLCHVTLKAREYAEAVTWCARAHEANTANVDALFKHVDARWAAGEEHAALQLLKTALMTNARSDRIDEVKEKALDLEQRLEARKRAKIDFYKDLGVDRSASMRDVKKAYHALAMKWHPDRKTGDDDEEHDEMFKKISKAYEILGDKELRDRYDAGDDVEAVLFNRGQQQPGGEQE